MPTFLQAYFEAMNDYNEYRCQYIEEMVCSCDDDDGKGDDFDRDICMYDCYVANEVEDICAENNPYNDDEQEQEEQFDLEGAIECQNVDFENDNNNNNNNNNNNQEEEIEYFMGPYCAEQGGAIYLGLFTDDTCTTFADSNGGASTYSQLAGESLPYSAESLINSNCFSCHEPEDFNNDGNDNEDEDQVIEMCEQIYETAGKCESALAAT